MADPVFTLLLILLVPSLAFMLWVIWALEVQIRLDRHHSDEIARMARSARPAPQGSVPDQPGSGTSRGLNRVA